MRRKGFVYDFCGALYVLHVVAVVYLSGKASCACAQCRVGCCTVAEVGNDDLCAGTDAVGMVEPVGVGFVDEHPIVFAAVMVACYRGEVAGGASIPGRYHGNYFLCDKFSNRLCRCRHCVGNGTENV